MRKLLLVSAALGLAIATPALASNCPKQMAAVDKALAENPNLSEEQLAEVRKLRAEGEELHEAGNHPESEAALERAREILGVSM